MSPGAAAALEGAFPDGTFEAPVEADAWAVGGARPLGIASPGSVDELRQVLAGAARAGVGVVPLGGGTDRGCEAPSGPFVVLSTRRLAGIEDYEPADLTVTAAAGTTLGDLERALTERGQWLPVDPPHRLRRTLGGLVATGTAGPLGTTYGAPRDHVLGLTVVTGDGEHTLQFGSKTADGEGVYCAEAGRDGVSVTEAKAVGVISADYTVYRQQSGTAATRPAARTTAVRPVRGTPCGTRNRCRRPC